MNRKLLIIVIVSLVISLTGIILIQLFWIRNAIRVKEELFDNSVNRALQATASALEIKDNYRIISNKFKNPGEDSAQLFWEDSIGSQINVHRISIDSLQDRSLPAGPGFVAISTSDEDKHAYTIKWTDSASRNKALVYNVDEKVFMRIDTLNEGHDDEMIFITRQNGNDDSLYIVVNQQVRKIKTKKESLEKVFEKMVIEVTTDPVPLNKRIQLSQTQDLLRLELQNQGITLPFEFGVFTGTDNMTLPVHSESFHLSDRHSAYKVNLFPNDAFAPATFLALKFPDKRAQLLRSVLWLLASSALLTLFIIVTFGMTVSFILKQKKISDIKSDFINNMTHEFKTPIATISLAADAISDDHVLSDKSRVNYFLGIIRQENKRMNNQVENVLQMALLDKKDFALHFELLDIHELIKQSVTHISLQVEKLSGTLHSELHAEHRWLQTDRIHFTNLIYNLLDNAIKYSQDKPEIRITTWNTKGGISISVEDKGIGLTPVEKSKIFDKFYRQATGNVHNVKGFGLGLSYVKAIVLLHRGEITVDSEVGKGSRFTVWLPGAVDG